MKQIAVALLLLLPAACTSLGQDDMDFNLDLVPIPSTPSPPEDITISDTTSTAGIVRLSKVLLSTQPQADGQKAEPDSPPKEPVKKTVWALSLMLEGSGADGSDSIHQDSGYTVIDGVRFDSPAEIGVNWKIREMSADLLVSVNLPSRFEFSGGLGYGHTSLDLHYDVHYTQVLIDRAAKLDEHLTLSGLDVKLGAGWYATPWLEVAVGIDVLFDSPPLLTFDGLVIIRPWSFVGLIAGYRVWMYSNDQRDGSALYLTMSGPLFGLELRF